MLGSIVRMAIHQTKQQTDIEKRLKILRQQIYGKSSEHSENSDDLKARKSESQAFRYTDTLSLSDALSPSESFRTDVVSLHQDLLKISILAGSALGIQLILFFLIQNHLLSLNFL